jgi:VanZ family protein
MCCIFAGSTGTLSSQNTSRFIGPFLRWLIPNISESAIHDVQTVVRKCGHLSEYALLAGLFWIGCRQPRRKDPRPWSWRPAALALGLAFLYAVTDEFHQRFVPSRYASPVDVLIDTAGAAFGLILIWVWFRFLRRQPP